MNNVKLKIDLTGKRFGKLIVIGRNNDYNDQKCHWNCICDCGNTYITTTNYLTSGKRKQCQKCGYRENGLKKRKDMTGEKFGRLLVLEMIYNDKHRAFCKCICECGKEKIVLASNLKRGTTKSCGCLEKESRYNRNHVLNLKGKKYGLLTVLEFKGIDHSGSALWTCKCDCGNLSCVQGKRLTSGKTYSCGCLKKSKRELEIEKILDELEETYIREYRFFNCRNVYPLPFDFYLPNYKLCIEVQGEQHYKSIEYFGGEERLNIQRKNDLIKKDYCKNNNITLIEIPYTMKISMIRKEIINILNPVTTTDI